MIADVRIFLQEVADDLPVESQERGFLLEAIGKLNSVFPLDPYNMEVMKDPAELIRKAYDLVEDLNLKAKLHFALKITEHMLQKSGTP